MIHVRRAAMPDAPALFSLINALADYEKLERPDDDARARLVRDGFAQAQPRFRAYLAERNGAPIGYAITFNTYSSFLARPTLYVEDLFVLPDAREHGAGSALLRHLAREALADDCGRMEWVVLDWNELAQTFDRRRGARHLSDWQCYRLTRDAIERLAVENEKPSI